MKKFILIFGLAVGFVLGSRMGRGPYEKLEQSARDIVDDPKVQEKAGQARDTVVNAAQETAGTVKDKAPQVADTVKDKAPQFADKIEDRAPGVADAVRQTAPQAADAVKEKAPQAADRVQQEAPRVADEASQAAAEGADAVKDRTTGPDSSDVDPVVYSSESTSAAGDAAVGDDKPLSS